MTPPPVAALENGVTPAREVYTLADLRAWPEATAGIYPPLRLAVFGDPVAHSASPPMHNAALEALHINLRYTRVHVRPDELAEALHLAARWNFVGVNLTIPHKQAGVALVDMTKDEVINTVRMERMDTGVRLRGFNTDGPGFVQAVETELGVDIEEQRVLILGLGGAGRALALACYRERCPRLMLVNRTHAKAQALAAEFWATPDSSVTAVSWDDEALSRALAETDLVVNTSSLGLKPGDPSPLPPELIPPHVQVFDTVYLASGEPTPLEAAARAVGARCIGGRALLLHQGALAFEHWFGGVAPVEEMRRALSAAVGSR